MRVLALETSGMAGSVAVLADDERLLEIELDPSRRTAQTLAPAVRNILRQIGWNPAEVSLVAVTSGPGSFTGLRIGVTTAKTFAYATGAALVGVDTLAVIAQSVNVPSLPAPDCRLWTVMNAERDQFFAASFFPGQQQWSLAEATHIVDRQTWLEKLTAGSLAAGPGLKQIEAQIPAGVEIAPDSTWIPRAAMVAQIGLRAFHDGRQSDCWSLVPEYYRESAAVERVIGSPPTK